MRIELERLLEFSRGTRRLSRPHEDRSVIISDARLSRISFNGGCEMSFSFFQITGAVRDDPQVRVSRQLIRFELECFLKCRARRSRVTAIERSQTLIDELLRLLRSRRNERHKKAHTAQKDFCRVFDHLCL